jgi:3alpha(or 20beta)-hydroxysteroid dehydrogenase
MPVLDGKTVLVTGSARGLGAVIARRMADHGATVVVSDVLDDDGRAVAAGIGDAARYEPLDVTDEAAWARVVVGIVERHGRIDCLVNNAAVLHLGTVEHTAPEVFRRVLEVNTTGPFLGIRAVVGPMRAAGGGSIVNVASVDALFGVNALSAYIASKWGLRGLTKTTALELGRDGIRVNTLCPVGGNPEMFAPWGAQLAECADDVAAYVVDRGMPRDPTLEEFADAAVFLASDLARFVTGADIPVDGGHTAGRFIAGMNRI